MMDEKTLMLLVSLPFLSIIVVTLLDLAENPVGTITEIYRFQISIYEKIFSKSSSKGSET